MTLDFPVTETTLGPAPKRLGGLIPAQRPAAEIPQPGPGGVLVFNNGERWVKAPGRIRGSESFVVDAIAVSVVQTRPAEVEVRIEIPSASLADNFTILSHFTCQIVDPVRAAENGPIDLSRALAKYLRQDSGLRTLGVDTEVADLRLLRHRVEARVRAWCDEVSPRTPGLEVELTSVEVLTPETLLRHLEQMRDARLARELAELLASHQDKDALGLAQRITQPEYLAAIGVLQDKVDLNQLIVDGYADRKTKDANILEFLKLLEKNGQLDRLPIDGRLLVQTLMTRLAGTPTEGLPIGGDAGLAIDTATLQQSIDSSTARKEKRFAVDDDAD